MEIESIDALFTGGSDVSAEETEAHLDGKTGIFVDESDLKSLFSQRGYVGSGQRNERIRDGRLSMFQITRCIKPAF